MFGFVLHQIKRGDGGVPPCNPLLHPLPFRNKIHQMTIEYIIIQNIWPCSSEFACMSALSVVFICTRIVIILCSAKRGSLNKALSALFIVLTTTKLQSFFLFYVVIIATHTGDNRRHIPCCISLRLWRPRNGGKNSNGMNKKFGNLCRRKYG